MAVDFYISKQNFINTLIVENTHPKLVSGYTIIQNTAKKRVSTLLFGIYLCLCNIMPIYFTRSGCSFH